MPPPMRCCGGCTRSRRSSTRQSHNRLDSADPQKQIPERALFGHHEAHRQRPRSSGQFRGIGIAHQSRHVLLGRDRKQPVAPGALGERQRFAAAEAVVIGKRHPHLDVDAGHRQRRRRTCRDRRCRRTPAPAGAGSPPAQSGPVRARRETAEACRAKAWASTGRASTGCPITRTACAWPSCASSGARSGPAGNTEPLPTPRRPSTTTIDRSFCSDGFWKPSSMMTMSAPAARAASAPATRSRATITGADRASSNGSSPTSAARCLAGSTRRGPASVPP